MHSGNTTFIESLEPRALLAAGAIDPSYHPQFDNASGRPRDGAVHVQLNNKSLHFSEFSGKPTIWRQNPDGSLDKSFGSKGKITLPKAAFRVTTAPDGKIIVSYLKRWPLGTLPPPTLHLARFDINGHLDKTFGGDGDVHFDLTKPVYSLISAAGRDGKIVVATFSAPDVYLYRINNNGTLDRSFGHNGIASPTPPLGGRQIYARYIYDLAIRPSGNRIIAAGQDIDGWAFWTFSPAGVMESKQSLDGVPDNSITDGNIFSVSVDADGSVVAAGRITKNVGGDDTVDHAIVARYPAPNSDAPILLADLGAFTAGRTALQSDGKVIVSGGNKLFRLNPDMNLDQTFGSGGQIDVGFGITDLAIQGDGKILVDGGSNRISDVYTQVREGRLTGGPPAAAVSRKTLLVSGSAGADDILIGSAKGIITVTVNGTDPFLFSRSTVSSALPLLLP